MKKFTHITAMNFRPLIYLLLGVTLAFSCENDSAEPIDPYNYYPLTVGRYAIYEVREETYSSAQANPVIKTTQEKDEIEDVITDANGISTYTFSRSTRANASEYWQKVKEYAVQRFPDKILTNIDNQTFFSMTFPVDSRIEWNGNTYNNLDAESYHYESVNEPATVGEQSFDRSLKVVERNDTSIINRYMGVKQYGLGVGLISDEQISFEFCQSEDCIGSGKIESGTRKYRKIIEFGTN